MHEKEARKVRFKKRRQVAQRVVEDVYHLRPLLRRCVSAVVWDEPWGEARKAGKTVSVYYEHKLTIGWRVKQGDIPEHDKRIYGEWSELEPLAELASEAIGERVWVDSLCEIEDQMCGDTQIVGVPFIDHEIPIGEFAERTKNLAEIATAVYCGVMRESPKDGPYLISWTQVS